MEQSGNKEFLQFSSGGQPPPQFYTQLPMQAGYPQFFPGDLTQLAQFPQYAGIPMHPSAYADNSIPPAPVINYQQPAPAQDSFSQKMPKGKRRSKNDLEGRIYKCNHCERTYLSYPALYTHIKTKHSLPGETPSLTNGRGRGRPKKNVVREDRPDPTSPLFFRTEDKKGGPTAILYGFEEEYNLIFPDPKKYGSYENHPLYLELYKLHSSNIKSIPYDTEHPGVKEFGKAPSGIPPAIIEGKIVVEEKPIPVFRANTSLIGEENAMAQKILTAPLPESKNEILGAAPSAPLAKSTVEQDSLPEQPIKFDEDVLAKKKLKHCDEIFGEYLDYVAKKVKKLCYKQILQFVLLFRECLNYYGEKRAKTNKPPGEAIEQPGKVAKTEEDKNNKEFCMSSNAEQAPDISNEFVTSYLVDVKRGFERLDAIELTQNFCHWLFVNGYTCSKLSLIQETL